jgi:hypothetical protein
MYSMCQLLTGADGILPVLQVVLVLLARYHNRSIVDNIYYVFGVSMIIYNTSIM